VDENGVLVDALDDVLVDVGFVGDLPEDLLEDVFEGDEPDHRAALVGDDGHVHAVLLHQAEKVVDERVVGDAHGREGEAAHRYLSEALAGRPLPAGALAPNGYPVTEEMIEGAAAMLADGLALIQRGAQVVIEHPVTMPEIHEANWGTTDFGAADHYTRTLHVWDFKFGHGYVDAFENWQPIDYAVGLVRHFQLAPMYDWEIDIRIYQPRSFHPDGPVKKWRFPASDLPGYAARLREAAHAAMQPDAPMSTGAHCTYCPARHACPALRRVGGAARVYGYTNPKR